MKYKFTFAPKIETLLHVDKDVPINTHIKNAKLVVEEGGTCSGIRCNECFISSMCSDALTHKECVDIAKAFLEQYDLANIIEQELEQYYPPCTTLYWGEKLLKKEYYSPLPPFIWRTYMISYRQVLALQKLLNRAAEDIELSQENDAIDNIEEWDEAFDLANDLIRELFANGLVK